MPAYYNEFDPKAAAWLRELIAQGHIAPGDVDERSITEVKPHDLEGYTQCHFFAGIGVWSYALRRSGWDDSRPVWTGSCPCQPFSAAGQGKGFDDERHLWPAWYDLISECRPPVVFGEQVASKAGLGWFDLVHTEMENEGYAIGAADLCAAGVGAPHIRQRLFFVAEWVGDAISEGLERYRRDVDDRDQPGRLDALKGRSTAEASGDGGLADSECERRQRRQRPAQGCKHDRPHAGRVQGDDGSIGIDEISDGSGRPGPTNGFWRNAEWLGCRDGKFRPVEPGTFPLVDGAAARVGRLRGYGNAINAEVAIAFISTYEEIKK